MAFREINTGAVDIKKHPGEPYIGTFIGSNERDGKFGKEIIWNFLDESGIPLSIYGFTMLNKRMGMVSAGAKVRITYTGLQKMDTKYGKNKDVHTCKVEIDADAEIADEEVGESAEVVE